jgi:predicted RNA-binding Zn-ribbon protein involved in translation (DUF1610 family)
MGMYDSVIARCPNCGNIIEWQSKAGKCSLYTFDIEEVPVEIAVDIAGETVECPECGELTTVHCEFDRYVKMFIT